MKKNIGFDLLRVWLSFEVVADHYWIVPTGGAVGAFFQAMKAYAVPCFMMLSFYLAISLAARYCMGIYCCHYALGWLLYAYVFPHLGVGRETLASNLLIWAASWFLCWLLSLVPGRFTKDLVQ